MDVIHPNKNTVYNVDKNQNLVYNIIRTEGKL